MSPLLLVYLTFLGSFTSCSARHIISINSSTVLQFSSLAWNPIAQHFVAGSTKGPTVYAIPDAGMVKCIISEPFSNSSDVSVSAVAVDNTRGRLIVAFSNPSSVAAYDLRSYMKIFAILLPELDGVPGGVAVDEDSGEMFVSSTGKGVVLTVGSDGDRRKVISEVQISGDQGFGGLVHTRKGYLITVQPTTGNLFKVNSEDGTATEVSSKNSAEPLALGGHAMVLCNDFSIFAVTNQTLLSIKSDKTWEQAKAKVARTVNLGKEERAVAVARRDATTYVLVKSLKGFRIEETRGNSWAPYGVVFYVVFYIGLSSCLLIWFTYWCKLGMP